MFEGLIDELLEGIGKQAVTTAIEHLPEVGGALTAIHREDVIEAYKKGVKEKSIGLDKLETKYAALELEKQFFEESSQENKEKAQNGELLWNKVYELVKVAKSKTKQEIISDLSEIITVNISEQELTKSK